MRIAVVSDSHQGLMHLEHFARFCRREGVEQIFHLGDVLDDVRWLQHELDIPVAAVAGNCDFYARHQREVCVTLQGKRFLLVHGDRHGVKMGYERLSYYGEEQNADCVLFGHTHRAFAGMLGRVLMINPGALKSGSMCLLEVNEKGIEPRFMDVDRWHDENAE